MTKEKTKSTVEELFKNHALYIIPKGQVKSLSFKILLDNAKEDGIICSWGYVDELSTDTDECIYFPKDLNVEGMYNDPKHDDAKKASLQSALNALRCGYPEEYTTVVHFTKSLVGKSEVELFMFIEGFGGAMFTNKRAYNKGHMEMESEAFDAMQQELLNKQFACLPFLKPFGLDIKKETFNEGDTAVKYQKWYEHWKTWMNSFDDDEWRGVNDLLCNGDPALAKYLPKKRWDEE